MSKPLEVHSLKYVQRLYEEAKKVCEGLTLGALDHLNRAVEEIEKAAKINNQLIASGLVGAAAAHYEKMTDADDIEIDELGLSHPSGTGGYWFAAWLWMPGITPIPENERMKLISYVCPSCVYTWDEEWKSACDSECPRCGCSNVNPIRYSEVSDVEACS